MDAQVEHQAQAFPGIIALITALKPHMHAKSMITSYLGKSAQGPDGLNIGPHCRFGGLVDSEEYTVGRQPDSHQPP